MKRYLLLLGFLPGLVFLVSPGCQKDKEEPKPKTATLKDIDGNTYKLVTIGAQVWMAENLKTTKFRDGENIIQQTGNAQWHNASTSAYCIYDNSAANDQVYGKLYNFYAASSGKLCPEGWRVPTQGDWDQLVQHLGGDAVAGGKLKQVGTKYWETDPGSTNSSGFTALPGGYRHSLGDFTLMGNLAQWWASNEYGANTGWSRVIIDLDNKVYAYFDEKKSGFAVRCIKE